MTLYFLYFFISFFGFDFSVHAMLCLQLADGAFIKRITYLLTYLLTYYLLDDMRNVNKSQSL